MATGRVPTTANSPLTAKGDLFTYSTAPARLAVGNNGEQIVADSSTSTGLRYQGNYAAGKNYVINGGFDNWQRGTTFTTDAANTQIYTADRWGARALYPGNGALQVLTQETTNVPTGSKYAIKCVVSVSAVANTERMTLFYTLENQDAIALAGKTLTLSLQAKAIGNIDRMYLTPLYSTTGGRIPDGTVISTNTKTINTSSFTALSVTFTVPSAATLTSAGTLGFSLVFARSSGAAEQIGDGYYIGQVQLEVGSVATAFARAGGTLQGELAACQRYYFRQTNPNSALVFNFGTGQNISTTAGLALVKYPVSMRTRPTALEQSGTAAQYGVTNASASVVSCSAVPAYDTLTTAEAGAVLYTVASGLVAGNASFIFSSASTGSYLGWSAEL